MYLVLDILIVVATALEAERLPTLPNARVVVSGIGAVGAALATQRAVLESAPHLILSAGIGGAYPWGTADIGDVVVSSALIYAGLGAEDGEHLLGLKELGFPLLETPQRVYNTFTAAPQASEFAQVTSAHLGSILTLETVTGSPRSLERLRLAHPNALCEAMEGAGVAHAAALHGVPVFEIRGISNMVLDRRDRDSWRIGAALAALHTALETGWGALG
jgi:futalosine hydrolase